MKKCCTRARHAAFLLSLFACCAVLGAQQTPSPASLPAAPSSSSAAGAVPSSSDEGAQTSRILGVLPNFRSVSANAHPPPQTVKQKFVTATQDTFDYSSMLFSGAIAEEAMLAHSTPEFHQGAAGFARYYWHTVADQSVENYMVEFVIPAITHEDSRYYTLGKGGGGIVKRTGYAVSRAVVTKSDSGKPAFNYGEIAGAGVAANISNFYYPSKERTVGNTFYKWGLDIGLDATVFVFHEFWPDVNQALFHSHDKAPENH